MPIISLEQIQKQARLEAHTLKHDYVGVEHLTIAMLNMRGSIMMHVMDETGISPVYLIDHILKKVNKGNSRQVFSQPPYTPRANNAIRAATDRAGQANRLIVEERDLLLTLLDDADSIPMRVFKALNLDLDALKESALNSKLDTGLLDYPLGFVYAVDSQVSNSTLEGPIRKLLQRMFHGYENIRIDRKLTGGYTRARLFVVTPIQFDIEAAPVVVKIARQQDINDEAQRYESFVKNTLPPFTARLEERPTYLMDESDLGALKYTLIVGPDQRSSNLTEIAAQWPPEKVGAWLREQLYPAFGRLWWQQARPNFTEIWKEYDWLLPPLLLLDYVPLAQRPNNSIRIRPPVKRSQLSLIRPGDLVTVENFNVQKIDTVNRELTLAINGSGTEKAYRIRFRNIDLKPNSYFHGEMIDHLTGKHWESRQDQLMMAARELIPDFDLQAELIPIFPDLNRLIHNPLKYYDTILEWRSHFVISKIHGDMHAGNIMVGPSNIPFLIDFSHARDGHALFDWACLEISLLNTIVVPQIEAAWKDIRQVIQYLHNINNRKMLPDDALTRLLTPIKDIRFIVEQIMMHTNQRTVDWSQYYLALTMCALRAITWEMPIANRRLMLLVAALSLHEMRLSLPPARGNSGETPPPD